MMKMARRLNKAVILFAGLTIFLASCSVTKRKYAGGYYIDWKNKEIPVQVSSEKAEPVKSIEKNYNPSNSKFPRLCVVQIDKKLNSKQENLSIYLKREYKEHIQTTLQSSLDHNPVTNLIIIADTSTENTNNATLKNEGNVAWICCDVGYLFYGLTGLLFFTVIGFMALFLLVISIVLFIISLYFALRVVKHKYNKKIMYCLYLDILGILLFGVITYLSIHLFTNIKTL